jgi:hypothetical protein
MGGAAQAGREGGCCALDAHLCHQRQRRAPELSVGDAAAALELGLGEDEVHVRGAERGAAEGLQQRRSVGGVAVDEAAVEAELRRQACGGWRVRRQAV